MDRLDPRGRTPLELAVCLGHLESTRVLLRHSADPTHCNAQSWTGECIHRGMYGKNTNRLFPKTYCCTFFLKDTVPVESPHPLEHFLKLQSAIQMHLSFSLSRIYLHTKTNFKTFFNVKINEE